MNCCQALTCRPYRGEVWPIFGSFTGLLPRVTRNKFGYFAFRSIIIPKFGSVTCPHSMSSGFNTLCEPVLASLARGFLRLNTAINLGTQRSLSSLSIPTQREVTKTATLRSLEKNLGVIVCCQELSTPFLLPTSQVDISNAHRHSKASTRRFKTIKRRQQWNVK